MQMHYIQIFPTSSLYAFLFTAVLAYMMLMLQHLDPTLAFEIAHLRYRRPLRRSPECRVLLRLRPPQVRQELLRAGLLDALVLSRPFMCWIGM
jgi:hypothetical protein